MIVRAQSEGRDLQIQRLIWNSFDFQDKYSYLPSNRTRLESVTEKQDSVFEDTATNSTTTSSFNEVINVENETAKL